MTRRRAKDETEVIESDQPAPESLSYHKKDEGDGSEPYSLRIGEADAYGNTYFATTPHKYWAGTKAQFEAQFSAIESSDPDWL